MRLLHKCDLFRVVQDSENHLTPATPYGAAISIATTVVLMILLISEAYGYFSGHKNCHITPSAFKNTLDADTQRRLDRLHFSIALPYMPCHRIATETVSGLEHNEETERDTDVRLYHIPYGSFASNSSAAYISGEALSEVERGCLVTGTAPIAARPASFNIILKDNTMADFRIHRPDFQIHYFSAGNAYKDWGVSQIRRQTLEPMSNFKSATDPLRRQFHQFFLQLIPTTVNLPGKDDRFGYQYTAFYSLVRYSGHGRAPGLYFSYRLSPFSMDCIVQYDTISHFLVNLCAVVGGVYTVAGMVGAGLEWLVRERRLKEVSARNRRNAETLKNAAGEAPFTV
uniref:Endoplasmic Reticulum-Golgi Intermediate Compartment (ERGIC) n=1 Tax=Leishmania utingensis TaxID=653362 RepID=A0AAW3B2J6_9TRYP